MRPIPVIFFLFSVVLCTCLKPPHYNVVPAITFQSVGADSVKDGSNDSIVITFTDGDGDLGTSDTSKIAIDSSLIKSVLPIDSFFDFVCSNYPKTFDLFYLDSRGHNGQHGMASSRIPLIPVRGSSKAISGTITFQTFGFNLTPGHTTDTMSYYIMVRDQAGHCSNVVRTSTIYITQ